MPTAQRVAASIALDFPRSPVVVKVHNNKQVINQSAHVVLGVNLRGEQEVLGLWLAEHEGAKF